MSYTLFSQKTVIAKKRHKCIWCGEGIEPWTKYVREASVYDGDFQDHKWHAECLEQCQIDNEGEWEYEISAYGNERPSKE